MDETLKKRRKKDTLNYLLIIKKLVTKIMIHPHKFISKTYLAKQADLGIQLILGEGGNNSSKA